MENTNFYVLEVRNKETDRLVARRIYNSRKQYEIEGYPKIEKLKTSYRVGVTQYICNKSITLIKPK